MEPAAAAEQPSTRATLKAVWRLSPPSRFLDYKDFLRALHAGIEERCGRYSFQQFSRDLGFERSNVTYMVVHGWRRMSHEQAEGACRALGMTGPEKRYLLHLLDYTDARDESERRAAFDALVALKDELVPGAPDRLMLRFFSEWHHAAVFELVAMPDFRSDAAWIAGRFFKRLSTEDVRASLELLESMGLIRYDTALQRHVKVDESLSTGDEVRGLAVAGYHLRMLELAAGALSQVPADEREIASVTLSVDEKAFRRLLDDVRLFKRYGIFVSEQCERPDRVVQLNLQLFAVTRT